jgi:hypothetical protein
MKDIREYIKSNADNSITVKCMGKSRNLRKIRITYNKKTYDISLYNRRFVMPRETANDDNLYNALRGVIVQHIYWLFGLDLSDKEKQKEQETDANITYTAKDWYKQTKEWIDFYCDDLKAIKENEKDYLYENIGEDYYKNKDMYPSFFDFKEFYKLNDLKIK